MDFYQVLFARKFGLCSGFYEAQFGRKLGGYSWISTDYEQTPYIYRAMPNLSHYYNREIMDAVVGGSVGWNQLLDSLNGDNYVAQNNGSATFADGIATLLPTENYGRLTPKAGATPTVNAGHKYFCSLDAKTNFTHTFYPLNLMIVGQAISVSKTPTANVWANYYKIAQAGSSGNNYFYFGDVNQYYATDDEIQIKNIMLTDLTLLFGSTIADYIYSLEQATAGAGVAFFKTLFPKPYYAYNAGELKSVKGLVSHDMTGFNQMNPESYIIGTGSHYNVDAGDTLSSGGGSSRATSSGENPITVGVNTGWAGVTYISEPLVQGSQYKLACSFTAPTGGNIRATTYILDGSNTVVERLGNYSSPSTISASTYTPTEAGLHFAIFIGSTSTQNVTVTDLCCHLVWDGSRNGEYEPYQKWSYPLDSDLELRGIPKIENGNLYYDGDMYESDGTVTRKYGIVDLGTLTFSTAQSAESGKYRFTAPLAGVKHIASTSDKPNVICGKFVAITPTEAFNNVNGISVSASSDLIIVYSETYASGSAEAFKTAMSGVYLVYEKATATTETATPFTKTQKCDSGGTEEWTLVGKNLFDFDGWLKSVGATYTKSGDTYTIDAGTTLWSSPFVFSDEDISVTISVADFSNITTTNVRMDLLKADGTYATALYADNVHSISAVASKVRFNWSSGATFSISKPQIEKGSASSPYEPYGFNIVSVGHKSKYAEK